MKRNGGLDAIVLAGGLGTRLRAAVSDVPKVMAPVGGRPFLDILLSQLKDFGQIRKVVLAVGYQRDLIINRYRGTTAYPFDIDFSAEESPLGTGGAIKQALPRTESDSILVLNGDSFVDFDLTVLRQFHEGRESGVTVVVVEVEDTARYGSVEIDDQTLKIARFSEKNSSGGRGLVNAGCYMLDRDVVDSFPAGNPVSFEKDVLPSLLPRAYAHVAKGKFIDIGTPQSYDQAEGYLQGIIHL